MPHVLESDLEVFRSSFTGQAITAADTDYDSARSLWNGCFDHHPAVIARCFGSADVAAAIAFARRQTSKSRSAAADTASPVSRSPMAA